MKIPILLFAVLILTPFVRAQERVNKPQLARQARFEFLHAWNGYKKYAWGHDDLKPLSKTYHDWYAESLLMTPVDGLDTMILMGLKDEAKSTREYIVKNLSFDKDISVQNFEITIRLLGGLLSSYQLTGDKRLLDLAEDLGNRLLPVFDSPTGLPYRYVNLKTGKVRGNVTNPAEAGTLLIEFGTLSKLTHKPIFYDKAKRALVETYKRRSPIGLVGTWINVETGQWTDTDSHISGAIDSYYEYLLKCAILFDDEDCRRMWQDSIAAINKYLAQPMLHDLLYAGGNTGTQVKEPELWYGHADMNTGMRTAMIYGALDAFFPALLALSGDLDRARRLQESSFKAWSLYGIEPEELNYDSMQIISPGYPLRPEIIESTYYLYHYAIANDRSETGGRPKLGARTSRPQYFSSFRRGALPLAGGQRAPLNAAHYQQMGQVLFENFVKHCRTDEGYAGLKSVVTKEKTDSMQSFLFAETFKYFYLLFASPKTLDFDRVIFNTEAHPMRREWRPAR